MNDTTRLEVRPEVEDFVAAVRGCFGDLGEEEREELLGGLEADVSELVEDRGVGALEDPRAYARELRSAAGFGPAPSRRLRIEAGVPVGERLDRSRSRWDEAVARPRVAPVWSFVSSLRPVWWVLRAWVVTVLLCVAVPGYDPYGLTWLPGVPGPLGLLLLAACVVTSTLVGMGRIWPGHAAAGSRGVVARSVLIALNALALCLVPTAGSKVEDARWTQVESSGAYDDSWVSDQGVLNRGQQVCNIAAYDALGEPLAGVQLFDQAGRPLDVRCYGQANRTVPWMLGDVTRWNVFPLGERDRPARTVERRSDLTGAAFPVPDRATTPEVTNPLVPQVEPEPGRSEGRDEKSGDRDSRGGRERPRVRR